MSELRDLLEILEESVKRNGEQPLTNKWLKNIVNLAIEKQKRDEENDAK